MKSRTLLSLCLLAITHSFVVSQETENRASVIRLGPKVKSLTEPPCSYCVDQNAKGLIDPQDPVLAWIRGAHNGGAFPLRHFISRNRVINDTYGLFFYDPNGGYVSAFQKDYGYELHGIRNGVMVVRSKDGTLWSALTGQAFEGPQKGKKLKRVPSITTTWSHWLLLHPESTAYDLFDGKRYKVTELPSGLSPSIKKNIRNIDSRLEKFSSVIGVEGKQEQLAIPLTKLPNRHVVQTDLESKNIVMFWHGTTSTAAVFETTVDGQKLTFYADKISPLTAPFKDKETGTRWTLAGRGIDGPLRGKELKWVDSVQCRWFAWSFEYPKTKVHSSNK